MAAGITNNCDKEGIAPPPCRARSGDCVSEGSQDALRVTGLQKSFRSLAALRGVSLSLKQGERLALLGPNGAGKTTLIRCLSGRTRPDEGEMMLLGRPIHDPGVRHQLGLVPQEIALYGDLSTRENL